MLGLHRKDRADDTELRGEVAALRVEVQALKRSLVILDAQFEELVEKAYKKWSRARMEIVREPEQAERLKRERRAEKLTVEDALVKAVAKLEGGDR